MDKIKFTPMEDACVLMDSTRLMGFAPYALLGNPIMEHFKDVCLFVNRMNTCSIINVFVKMDFTESTEFALNVLLPTASILLHLNVFQSALKVKSL